MPPTYHVIMYGSIWVWIPGVAMNYCPEYGQWNPEEEAGCWPEFHRISWNRADACQARSAYKGRQWEVLSTLAAEALTKRRICLISSANRTRSNSQCTELRFGMNHSSSEQRNANRPYWPSGTRSWLADSSVHLCFAKFIHLFGLVCKLQQGAESIGFLLAGCPATRNSDLERPFRIPGSWQPFSQQCLAYLWVNPSIYVLSRMKSPFSFHKSNIHCIEPVFAEPGIEIQFHIEEFLEFCKNHDIYHEYWPTPIYFQSMMRVWPGLTKKQSKGHPIWKHWILRRYNAISKYRRVSFSWREQIINIAFISTDERIKVLWSVLSIDSIRNLSGLQLAERIIFFREDGQFWASQNNFEPIVWHCR